MSIIDLATKAAMKARHRHRLGALIIKGGNVISTGWNYSVNHAETVALGKIFDTNIKGSTLVVVRMRRDGRLGMSFPCASCLAAIVESGISRIVYTDQDGLVQSRKVSELNIDIRSYTQIWDNCDTINYKQVAVLTT